MCGYYQLSHKCCNKPHSVQSSSGTICQVGAAMIQFCPYTSANSWIIDGIVTTDSKCEFCSTIREVNQRQNPGYVEWKQELKVEDRRRSDAWYEDRRAVLVEEGSRRVRKGEESETEEERERQRVRDEEDRRVVNLLVRQKLEDALREKKGS